MKKLSEDPCYATYAAALKCLDDHDYNRAACQQAFDAFKQCRKDEDAKKDQEFREQQKKDPVFGWLYR